MSMLRVVACVLTGLWIVAAGTVPTIAADKPPVGKWEIVRKPQWVEKNYLAFRSDVFAFAEHGNCLWGTAHGTCQMLPDGKMKVTFPMQQATPGFTGVLEVRIDGDTLTLTDTLRPEPIVLRRWLDMEKLGRELALDILRSLRSRGISVQVENIRPFMLAVVLQRGRDLSAATAALADVFEAAPSVKWDPNYRPKLRGVTDGYAGFLHMDIFLNQQPKAAEVTVGITVRPDRYSPKAAADFFADLASWVEGGDRVTIVHDKMGVTITVPDRNIYMAFRNNAQHEMTGWLGRKATVLADMTRELVVEVPNADEKAKPLRVKVVWTGNP